MLVFGVFSVAWTDVRRLMSCAALGPVRFVGEQRVRKQ